MGLFKSDKPSLFTPVVTGLPVTQIDLSKRYDIYSMSLRNEERLYENVRIVGIRTLDRVHEFSSTLLGGFLEIEPGEGPTLLIPSTGIQMICEHGQKPVYTVVRSWPRRENS